MAASNSNQKSTNYEDGTEGESYATGNQLSDADNVEKGGAKVSADFPDGGGRAWAVAIGTSAILFCTFGYINSFGYAIRNDYQYLTSDACLLIFWQCLSGLLSRASIEDDKPFDNCVDRITASFLPVCWNRSWRALVRSIRCDGSDALASSSCQPPC